MGSIVLELQRETMESNTNTVTLLRKALFVARKLKVKQFEEWISLELSGYKLENSIPEYREVIGKVQWFNPYRGWCPLIIQNEEIAKVVTSQKIGQQISEIQALISGDHTNLVILLPQGIQNLLSKSTGTTTEYQLSFSKSQLDKIQDTVKNIIFDWALKLEEDGIMGNGLSFNEKEKQEATKNNYSINHFHGNASGIQIQQDVINSTQSMSNQLDTTQISEFIVKLKESLTETGLSPAQQNVIESDIEAIKKEINSVQPVTTNLQTSINSIKTTLEGAGGNLIASGLLYMIDKIPF